MRAVKAKALRKLSQQHPASETTYDEVKHKPKLVPTGGLNQDGTPKRVVITPTTRVLSYCQRGMYQQLKKA